MAKTGLLVLAALVMAAAFLAAVHGAGECGATPPDRMALKLAPCASAAQDSKSAPSNPCCTAVHNIGKQSRECLCAVMLSNTAKSSGIKPEVAVTIPKRCNLVDRPVGYKCGGNRRVFFTASAESFRSSCHYPEQHYALITLPIYARYVLYRLHSAMMSCKAFRTVARSDVGVPRNYEVHVYVLS
jgi:hypothetical protein